MAAVGGSAMARAAAVSARVPRTLWSIIAASRALTAAMVSCPTACRWVAAGQGCQGTWVLPARRMQQSSSHTAATPCQPLRRTHHRVIDKAREAANSGQSRVDELLVHLHACMGSGRHAAGRAGRMPGAQVLGPAKGRASWRHPGAQLEREAPSLGQEVSPGRCQTPRQPARRRR